MRSVLSAESNFSIEIFILLIILPPLWTLPLGVAAPFAILPSYTSVLVISLRLTIL